MTDTEQAVSAETICDMISRGMLDAHLTEIRTAVNDRSRGTREFMDLTVGSRVVLNDMCGTKYLRGEKATVTGIRRTKVNIRLDNSVGRFSNASDIVVPTTLLDMLIENSR